MRGQSEAQVVIRKREQFRADRAHLTTFAREYRRQPTEAERLLWSRLRNRQLEGFKFKREYTIGDYIADFVCVEAMLVIELDGGIHATQVEYDKMRDRFLETQHYRVLRFENVEVTARLAIVLERILQILREPAPLP